MTITIAIEGAKQRRRSQPERGPTSRATFFVAGSRFWPCLLRRRSGGVGRNGPSGQWWIWEVTRAVDRRIRLSSHFLLGKSRFSAAPPSPLAAGCFYPSFGAQLSKRVSVEEGRTGVGGIGLVLISLFRVAKITD